MGKPYAEGQNLFVPNAGIDALQLVEAAEEQPRARQQHHRQRELGDDESAPRPLLTRAAARAFAQRLAGWPAAQLPSWNDAEYQSGSG